MSITNRPWLSVETHAQPDEDGHGCRLGTITIKPHTAGEVVLGTADIYLSRERTLRRRGMAPDTVVFDARAWDDDGRYGHLQWYGDVDIAARGHEFQRVAELTGTPLYVVEYGSPPWNWPTPSYYGDKKVFTFHPESGGSGYPLAHLPRMDLRARARDVYAPRPTDTPVWWEPVGADRAPYCFMNFATRTCDGIAAAELPDLDRTHPLMRAAIEEMRDLVLAALDRDGWRPADPELRLEDVIDGYVRYAMIDVLPELQALFDGTLDASRRSATSA